MDEILGFIALVIAIILIPVFGHVGQALLVKTEFIAYGLTDFGITNPTAAWLVLGGLVGGAAGVGVGLGRAGRKVEMSFACAMAPALLVLLSVLSSGAPKPEPSTAFNN